MSDRPKPRLGAGPKSLAAFLSTKVHRHPHRFSASDFDVWIQEWKRTVSKGRDIDGRML